MHFSYLVFLRATAYMLWRVYAIARPSVCPSVRPSHGYNYRKMAEANIMKFLSLVFVGKVSSRNSKGFPRAGASNKWHVGKMSSFVSLSVNISKTVADTANVTIND